MTPSAPPLCSAFMAISQDGLVARADGALDWLDEANRRVPPGEDCGFAAFMDRVDALVMGRKTLEAVLALGAWPYGDKPVVLLSHSLQQRPANAPATVRLAAGSPAQLVRTWQGLGWQRLYIDGPSTAKAFMHSGCLQELVLTEVPCRLGQGVAWWGPEGVPAAWTLQREHIYPFGFVQRHYLLSTSEPDLRVQKAFP